jgi:hypothetical protein
MILDDRKQSATCSFGIELGVTSPAMKCNRGVNCAFVLPIHSDDFHRRWRSMRAAFTCLRKAIIEATPELGRFQILAYINGESIMGLDPDLIVRVLDVLNPLPVLVLTTVHPGKVEAVNSALNMARSRQSDLLFCIDNDIVFGPMAIRHMIELNRKWQRGGVACKKAPLVKPGSTRFQRVYSYSFQVSFSTGMFPKRPTGSLYCVDPQVLTTFPSACNEGDFLAVSGIPLSEVIVHSEFPRTMEEEIHRRVRLRRGSRAIGYSRPADNLDLMREILNVTTVHSSITRDARFLESMSLYERVFSTVDGLTS